MVCRVFICEDFPKKKQKLVSKATNIGKAQNNIFFHTIL